MAGKRPNGAGTVRYNEERDRWEARATVGLTTDGKPRRRMVTAATEAEAWRRLRELLNAVDAGTADLDRSASLAAIIREYLELGTDHLAPATLEQYRSKLRLYITPAVGHLKARELQPRHVTRLLRQMEADGKSPNTRRLARAALSAVLSWAMSEQLVARNVAELAPAPKIPQTRARALTPPEARKLLEAAARDRLEPLWHVYLGAGLRLSEALGLTWADVDIAAGRIRVERTVQRVPGVGLVAGDVKTRKSRRTIVLPGPTVDAIRRHRVAQHEERLAAGPAWEPAPLGLDLVFRNQLGGPLEPRNVNRQLSTMCEKAKIGHRSPHELRHTYASVLLARGANLIDVADQLGHSSPAVTGRVYAHAFDAGRQDAADRLAAALYDVDDVADGTEG